MEGNTFQGQNEEVQQANARLLARRAAANPPKLGDSLRALKRVAVPHSESERNQLNQLREVIGIEGMEKIGGCWLTYIRGNDRFPPNPDKCQRVLAEAQRQKKEGFTPDTTWHQYVMDLFKRFAR